MLVAGLALLGYALSRLMGRKHDSLGGALNRSGPQGESFGGGGS